jgi:hypothetical protein
MVRDHTYLLAQDNKIIGPRALELESFLLDTWAIYAAQMMANGIDTSRVDGVSVWWLGETRHVAVTHRDPTWDRSATVLIEPSAPSTSGDSRPG